MSETTLDYIKNGLANGQQVFRSAVLEKLLDELDSTIVHRPGDPQFPMDHAVCIHRENELKRLLQETEKRLSEANRQLQIERKRVIDYQRKIRESF